jgi:hypothetical protein
MFVLKSKYDNKCKELEAVKAVRNWYIEVLAEVRRERNEAYDLVSHWRTMARATFIAFSIVTLFCIYLLGNV